MALAFAFRMEEFGTTCKGMAALHRSGCVVGLLVAACHGQLEADVSPVVGDAASGGSAGAETGSAGASGDAERGTGGTNGGPGERDGSGGASGDDVEDGFSVQLEGAYDITFRNVVATTLWDAGTGFASPSEGARVRLDIRRLPSGLYEALAIPRWGEPMTYSVSVEPHLLVLTGQPELALPPSGATIANLGLSDTWTKLRISYDDSTGALGGTGSTDELQGSGVESTINGDTAGWIAKLTAGGTVVRDSTAPEVRTEVASPLLPAGQLLPWENVAVRAAEGIAFGALVSGIVLRRLEVEDGGAIAKVNWNVAPTDAATGWSGIVTATGRTASWDGLPGAMTEILVPRSAVVDSSKHEMAADYVSAFSFANIGPAVASHAFDSGPLPAMWGQVTFRGAPGADPLCESGGCAVLGPFQRGLCDVSRLGIAGRLSVPAGNGKLQLRVRYRVMTAWDLIASWPAPFSIDVAVPAKEPVSTKIPMPPIIDLGTDAGDLRYASAFLDVRIRVPDAAAAGDAPADVGFAIYAGTKGDVACVNPAMNYPVKTQVVIDGVTLEPIVP